MEDRRLGASFDTGGSAAGQAGAAGNPGVVDGSTDAAGTTNEAVVPCLFYGGTEICEASCGNCP
jgi:hypothetical protein